MTFDDLAADLDLLGDWTERYRYIIELGQSLPAMAPEERIDAHLVRGCQSRVWLVAERADDRVVFRADSDAHIVRGLAAILLLLFSGKASQAIETIDAQEALAGLGLERHLSPSRANGLFAMCNRIKALAKEL